jgi:hypothetical protein
MVLKTVDKNTGTQAAFVDMTHGNVTLDRTNSVDKAVDKDPKDYHEDIAKGQEDSKLEETVASLNSCPGSDSKKVSNLVSEKENPAEESSKEGEDKPKKRRSPMQQSEEQPNDTKKIAVEAKGDSKDDAEAVTEPATKDSAPVAKADSKVDDASLVTVVEEEEEEWQDDAPIAETAGPATDHLSRSFDRCYVVIRRGCAGVIHAQAMIPECLKNASFIILKHLFEGICRIVMLILSAVFWAFSTTADDDGTAATFVRGPEVLQPRYNDGVLAQLDTIIALQEKQETLDIESMALLEEKYKKTISGKVHKRQHEMMKDEFLNKLQVGVDGSLECKDCMSVKKGTKVEGNLEREEDELEKVKRSE